ncbi:MAG: AMP-binding protein [Chloroflexi bacterium]|nr:AMP-binding protein [Chloroflexota bacterium]
MSFTTICSLLNANLEANPDREALIYRDQRYSYRQLGEKVDRLAEALTRLGIKKGDKVAVDIPNWPEFVFSFFAIARLGAVVVMINTRYRVAEVQHILKDSDAVAVILPVEFDGFTYLPMIETMRAELPLLRHVIAVGETTGVEADVLGFTELLGSSSGRPVQEADIDHKEDVGLIMYTSGTTGTPKGAMITHFNLVKNSEVNSVPYDFTPGDVFLVLVPASHIIGLFSLVSVFLSHARVILVDAFKTEPVLQIIARERVTVQYAVPTVFTLELANADKHDLSSLRTGLIAGASCPPEIVRRLIEIGFQVHIGLGMTETAGGLTYTTVADDLVARTQTVGRPAEGVEMKFVDDDRRDLPPGQVGEIAIKSYGRMKGYYKNPGATEAAIDADGWFYTGDLGVKDERGYVRIVGRKKDMIIRGGFNIYPAEVEGLLFTNPKVLEVAVVGVPDSVLGEKTCACIRPREGVHLGEAEIKEFCRGKLADFKMPDYVRFVDSFPQTATGKIHKIGLREEILKTINPS